ncbi:uncharacterized protein BO88DRAFT_184470 [Aspergillus vadensis CBS 113365]|uniref:Uncharacterized protein n=1 Tax=Aspergillus vadensis (strain CBS 113365 / IMI 142717 / IBT 24658) TaxID=1448311 RepID=A0A319AVB9_ASPVC|nr:hypothetical protein BO88DRAFT_184470 [Aspergillus vadensis CBS 113365]PYH64199.1 hypothetical protein BO88DRAFT_184470 [Aspergillus vadensis CBS 113365]
MEADGGWREGRGKNWGGGVMDDLLSQRTALLQCLDQRIAATRTALQKRGRQKREAAMGLFLAPANKNKPKKALRTLGTIPPTGNDDDDARWRQIGLVDPELSRILWVSLLTLLLLSVLSFHSHPSIHTSFCSVSLLFNFWFPSFLIFSWFTPSGDGYRVRFVLLLRWPDAHEVPVRYPAKVSSSYSSSYSGSEVSKW